MSENNLRKLTEKFCSDVGQVFQSEVSGQIKTLIEDMRKTGVPAKKSAKRNIPSHCVFEGCKNPHCGPKYRFLCREHRDAKMTKKPAQEKEAAK